MQKLILGGVLLLSGCVYKGLYEKEKTEGIFLDKNSAACEAPIKVQTTHISSKDISSCTWCVGEREVLKSDTLVSYTPSQEDMEHFIRLSVTLKDGTCYEDSLYLSCLPVLYLESETAYEDVTREDSTSVRLTLTDSTERDPEELYQGAAQIHVRGNSTSTLPKLPFKLKLEEKANLLGLGETKHWVLLANAFDSTLLRNKLVYEFSGDLGAVCYMHSQNITLIYNGEYEGVYQLCEQVRIDKNSVDIYNWESVAGEAAKNIALELEQKRQITPEERPVLQVLLETELLSNLSWIGTHSFDFSSLQAINDSQGREIPSLWNLEAYVDFHSLPPATGGVLLEMDFFHTEANLRTNYALPLYFNKPLAGNTYPELNAYVRTYIQALEYAFHETDFTYHNASPHYRMTEEGWFDWQGEFQWVDAQYEPVPFSGEAFDGSHYSQLIDLDSLVVNFLVCEFTVNWDSMKNSVYLYKDIEGPFYLAPAWDYDWAWGNSAFTIDTWAPTSWQTTNEYFASENYYQSVQWNRYLIRDPYFLVCVYEKYGEIRETEIEELIREGGRIDTYAAQLAPAAKANDARWGGSMGTFEGQKFEEGIASMKAFIRQRTAWLDAQFSSVEALNASLGYYIPSHALVPEPADTSSYKDMTKITVHSTFPDCTDISFQVNGTQFFTAPLKEGKATLLLPNQMLRPEEGALNTVQLRALNAQGQYLINPEGTTAGEYTNTISNYVYFYTPQNR